MTDDSIMLDDDFMLDDDIFSEKEEEIPVKESKSLSFFHLLPVQITLALASAEITLGELMKMGQGDVISLDRMVGDPLDVRVNGILLGKGEVVEVNNRYGVRLLEVETGGIAAMQK